MKAEAQDTDLRLLHALPLDESMWVDFVDLLPGATYTPTSYEYGSSIGEGPSASISVTK